MLDKSSAIAAINELDKANFDNISNGLGAMALLPDDAEKLYVQHQTVIGRHLISAEARAAGALFVLCRKHVALGTTSPFRLYSAQKRLPTLSFLTSKQTLRRFARRVQTSSGASCFFTPRTKPMGT